MFAAQNEAYIDWWLLQRFPGRTLEELDAVDWVRLQRAMEVDRVVEAEQRRIAWFKQDDPPTPDPDDLRMWAQHDRLLGQEEDYG